MKKVFIVLFVVLTAFATNAKAQKFGHIDISQLIQIMPERASALATLEASAKEYEDVLATMQAELQKLFEDYQANATTMSDLVRQAKEEDMQTKNQRIETFRAKADQEISQKQQELMKPIFDKVDTTISTVAKELGLIYVFDVSSRVVLYKSNESVDLLPLVKKKMGIE